MPATHALSSLRSCHCCGLIQRLPDSASATTIAAKAPSWACARCRTRLHGLSVKKGDNTIAATLAASALSLFPMAIILPFLHIQRLGHSAENSLWGGVLALFED